MPTRGIYCMNKGYGLLLPRIRPQQLCNYPSNSFLQKTSGKKQADKRHTDFLLPYHIAPSPIGRTTRPVLHTITGYFAHSIPSPLSPLLIPCSQPYKSAYSSTPRTHLLFLRMTGAKQRLTSVPNTPARSISPINQGRLFFFHLFLPRPCLPLMPLALRPPHPNSPSSPF